MPRVTRDPRDQLELEARRRLDVERLRDTQAEAVDVLVGGRDALVVMPTGGGKSAIYQLAGALIPGGTVVVSPLIALQQDQLEHIEELDVGAASALNSTLGERARRDALERFAAGDVEFLFVAPEQLRNDDVLAAISRSRVGLFVVDEAHCASLWGHDFRPDYLELGDVRDALGSPPLLALTATASPPVRDDIARLLRLREPVELIAGFDRPNLHLSVARMGDGDDADPQVLETACSLAGTGIVYAATRDDTERLAAALRDRGVEAQSYHAGLRATRREQVQQDFTAGRTRVVVATWAFGLGIDKPDVRFVLHHAVPASVDAYYQEIGRAGRDGEPAVARLWFRERDLQAMRFRGATTRLEEAHAAAVLAALDEGPATTAQLVTSTGLSKARVGAAVRALEQLEVVERRGRPRRLQLRPRVGALDTIARRVVVVQDGRRRADATRGDMLRAYADTTGCRRQALLAYFADPPERPCGNCDTCDSGEAGRAARRQEAAVDAVHFPVQSRVRHASLGDGTVVRHDGEAIVVLFDEHGYRTLDSAIVLDQSLLEVVGDEPS